MKRLDPAELCPAYARFLRGGRVLLTGHSHQAWPDVAREGLVRSFDDAADHVDDKWERAMAVADRVREGVVQRIGGRIEDVALGQSTNELVTRLLSALDFTRRRHVVTTSGEFHSLDRTLRRLAEAGVEVTFVAAQPVATLAGRLAAAIREDTAAVMASTVLFETSTIVPGLREVTEVAHARGAAVLYDAYHAFNVVPFQVDDLGPDPVFVTSGGYKYAQWGEGVCFLRVPPGCELRPVLTGWFSDFANLDRARDGGPVSYGPRGADRFAGSTYDPASHYRAAAVIDFFEERPLSVDRLRALSLAQTGRILAGLDGFEVLTPREPEHRGGFVAVRLAGAAEVVRALRAEGVYTDSRGEVLRLGPAPYVTDDEIDRALDTLRRVSSAPGGR